MAKECILCNKKLRIINGENLQGNLCDVCFSICSGYNLMNMEYENDSKRFNECYEEIATSIDKLSVAESQKNRIKDLFFEEVQALHIKKFGVDSETLIRRIKEEEQKEQNRVNYAKSFNEFYEYDVVTIINKDHGIVDKDKMRKILMEYARNGWKLHTMYSNELGKMQLEY